MEGRKCSIPSAQHHRFVQPIRSPFDRSDTSRPDRHLATDGQVDFDFPDRSAEAVDAIGFDCRAGAIKEHVWYGGMVVWWYMTHGTGTWKMWVGFCGCKICWFVPCGGWEMGRRRREEERILSRFWLDFMGVLSFTSGLCNAGGSWVLACGMRDGPHPMEVLSSDGRVVPGDGGLRGCLRFAELGGRMAGVQIRQGGVGGGELEECMRLGMWFQAALPWTDVDP